MKRLTVAILAALIIVTASGQAPARPTTVPDDAVWGGKSDGGCWVVCKIVSISLSMRCCCQVYDENGRLLATGFYTPAYREDSRYLSILFNQQAENLWAISGFDGKIIYLQSGHFLVPDGCVDYQLADSHWVHIRYEMGVEKEGLGK